jgi:hypothetical protein
VDSLPLPETKFDRLALPACCGGAGVAFGAADGEPEQIAKPPDVTVGGQSLVQDAVLADGLFRGPDRAGDPAAAQARPRLEAKRAALQTAIKEG